MGRGASLGEHGCRVGRGASTRENKKAIPPPAHTGTVGWTNTKGGATYRHGRPDQHQGGAWLSQKC